MNFVNILNKHRPADMLSPVVYEDLKLKELLNFLFYTKIADSLWQILQYPCKAEDIRLRQQVFSEMSRSEIITYLNELSSVLTDIEKFYEIYNKCDKSRKSINFLTLMSYYINFCRIVFNNIPVTKAEFLVDFANSFKQLFLNDCFIEMERECTLVKSDILNTEPMMVEIMLENGKKTSCSISITDESSISSKLREITDKLNLAADASENIRIIEPASDFSSFIERLYPGLFVKLNDFMEKYEKQFDAVILQYKNQLSFYLNMHSLFEKLKNYGIPLCLPIISQKKQIYIENAFDITLLIKTKCGIIPNDADFTVENGFFILTGANGGGKTTYIRTIGICQLLFAAGGYIPAEGAQIYPINKIHTHFPADEKFRNVGRLKDETERLNKIYDQSDENTLILLNETFSSTNENLSLEMSIEYIKKFCRRGVFGVFVSHLHPLVDAAVELNNEDIKTKIDVLSTEIDKDINNIRTYKIIKKREIKSYAYDILKKYGLTKQQLDSRIRRTDL